MQDFDRGERARCGGQGVRTFLAAVLMLLLAAAAAVVAPDRLITSSGVGPVQLGMTIAAAEGVLPGFTLARFADAAGMPLVAVRRDGETMMTLFAGESLSDAPADAAAEIVLIDVLDPGYRTEAGIGPQSPLNEVERAYGRLIRIRRSELARREYAEFDQQPPGMAFRVVGPDDGEAGLYEPGTDMTDRARAASRLLSVSVQRLP